MNKKTDELLQNLKDLLLTMGGIVEMSILHAVEGLIEGDLNKIKKVDELEQKINSIHIEIDDICVNLLALYQPMASDLRLIISVVKINCDLERIGDQSVNIARNAEYSIDRQTHKLKSFVDFKSMVSDVISMVKQSLDAFVSMNLSQAESVLLKDDAVDKQKDVIFHSLINLMKENPQLINQCLSNILIARNLERIADHATNIAEDVIFLISGKDVRHHSKPLKKQ